jgi:hypothetical protein
MSTTTFDIQILNAVTDNGSSGADTLSIHEMISIMKSLGEDITEEEAREMLGQVDEPPAPSKSCDIRWTPLFLPLQTIVEDSQLDLLNL